MTPQELKASILQLAIQGKLVEQRKEEGTAKREYSSIEEVSPDAYEIPFDIPQTWMWVSHNSLFEISGGSQPPKAKFLSEPKPGYIRLYQIRDYGETPVPVYIPIETASKTSSKGDILLARYGGSLGKVFWAEEGAYNVAMAKVIPIHHEVEVFDKYVYWYYHAGLYQTLVSNNSRSAQAGFNKEDLKQLLFPLPPLAEQKRIVAKIEELLPYIDRYEQAWSRLEDFNRRFPVDMQKSILQMAIQGKLVEQRPEEGTGEELYQQIQQEKQRLIKAGTIKKEKPLPEITEDEIPFDIPEGWKWVQTGEIFDVGTGMTPLKGEPRFYQGGSIPWVTSSLTSQYYIESAETNVTEYALANTSLVVYPAHTLIVAMYGQGKTRGQVSELLLDATINQACAALRNILYYPELVSYVHYCYLYNYEVLRKKAEGTSQPNLNLSKIKETLLPLPPLAEQKRIVAKLEEILPLCDRLKWS